MSNGEASIKKEGTITDDPLQALKYKNDTKLTVVDSDISQPEEKNRGWIALPRSVQDLPFYDDPEKLKWLIDIWLTVNHTEKKVVIGNRVITCKRGQCIKSTGTWAKMWRVDENRVRRYFKLLEQLQIIVTENLVKTTRLTLCIYDSYEKERRRDEVEMSTQTKLKRRRDEVEMTTTKQLKNVNNEDNVNNSIEASPVSSISYKKLSEDDFLNEVNSITEYEEELRREFFDYWSEPNDKGKMRFQLQTTWNTKKRLATWLRRKKNTLGYAKNSNTDGKIGRSELNNRARSEYMRDDLFSNKQTNGKIVPSYESSGL